MARTLRVQYPGAIYHVMNRGDRREPIFKDDPDRQRFIETLLEPCFKTAWRVHALRQETTMMLSWIADRLQMGTRTHLAHLLYWHKEAGKARYY
jgi:hypothetical protein